MSTATSSFTAQVLAGQIAQTSHMHLKDFDATPDTMLTAKCGDDCRSILDVTNELTGFVASVEKILKGESVSRDEMMAAMQGSSDRATARAAFEAANNSAIATVSGLSDETLAETVMAPWGMEATKANLAGWIALHNMYHCGQTNFIQLLHGDKEVHWM